MNSCNIKQLKWYVSPKEKYVVGGVFSLLTSLLWVLFSSHDHAVLRFFWDLVCPPGSFGDDISCYLPYQELHSWFGFVDWVNCGVIATSNFYLHNVLQWVWGTWSSPIHVGNGRATGAIIECRYCQWSSWRSFLCQLFGMILCLVALWDKCCGDLLIFASTFELLNLVA